MKRAPLLLVVAALLVALLAVLFLLDDTSSRSSERQQGDYRAEGVNGLKSTSLGDAGGGDTADAERLRELIAQFGGFTTRGRVVLSRPLGPGAGLEVKMSGVVSGVVVEVEGRTDSAGIFRLPALPRSGDFTLEVSGERVQDLTKPGLAPAETELDLGVLRLDRFYFVSGQVFGDGRRGLANVRVMLTEPSDGGFSFLRASQQRGQDDPLVAAATTDATGKFRLTLARPGVFSLGARAEGWASQYKTNLTVGGEADIVVKMFLTPGYEVVGYVLDAAGRPVAGAAVTYNASNWTSWSWPKEYYRTDGDGRFAFRVEPRADEYILSATTGKGLDLTKRFTVPLTDDLIVRAPGSGVLKGRVVDAQTAQPVADAEVLLSLSREQRSRGRGMPEFSKAIRTDSFGAYRVEGVGDSHFQSVSVRAEGYADLRAMGRWGGDRELWTRIQRVKPSGDTEVTIPDLPLERGKTLSGYVTDAKTNATIAGATVELWDFIMGNRQTVTGEDGKYAFAGVGDRIAMIVVKDGYAPFRESPWPGFQLEEDSDQALRDLAIEPGGVVRGRVRTQDGRPVAGALIRLEPVSSGRRNWTLNISLRDIWTYTDKEGEFVLRAVPPVKVTAEARAPGYDLARSKEVTVETGRETKRLEITVLPAATVAGKVVARDGSPVPTARITIAKDPGEGTNGRNRWRTFADGVRAFSDDSGRFRAEGVPVGDLLIRTEAEGFATSTTRRAAVEPGATVQNVKLELAPSFLITGKVVDVRGEPVTSVWVRARHTSSPDGELQSDVRGARVEADGTFAVRNLPAGSYTIEVRAGRRGGGTRYQNLTREGVPAGTKNLALTLQPAPEPEDRG